MPHLRRGPWKDEPGHPSQWRPRQPPQEPTNEPAPAEVSMERAAPTEEPTEELAPAEASMEEEAPTEEPDEEPATLMATVSGLAEEPDILPVWHEEKEKGEVPHSNFPGWTEVLHPTWSVIPAGQTLSLLAS